jgi:hypothetical protein
VLRGTAAVALVLVLAACGGSSPRHAAACTSPRTARALVRVNKDVAAIRKAAALPTKDTFKGNAAVNRATDTFMNDVFTLPLDNLTRNRLIDHAAAALAGSCSQCFQALEANRPIITIAHTGHKGNCRK